MRNSNKLFVLKQIIRKVLSEIVNIMPIYMQIIASCQLFTLLLFFKYLQLTFTLLKLSSTVCFAQA